MEIMNWMESLHPESPVREYLRWMNQSGDDPLYKQKYEQIVRGQKERNKIFLTVVVRTQGKRMEMLQDVLTCLQAQSDTDFETVIICHRTSKEACEAVRSLVAVQTPEFAGRTRVIQSDEGERGAPLNLGFAHAKGRYAVCLDDDDLVLFLSRNLCRRPAVAELRMQHPGIEPAKISLCRPGSRYSGQVMDFRDELKQNGDEFDGCAGLEDCASFEEWIRFGDRLRVKYKEGYVPSEVFLAVRETDDRLVGIIDYRHPLTDFLMNFGGNIGYSIRPSERRKGYASEMLRLMLELCRFYGEKRILLTCDSDNTASEKTILKNGGVLENEIEDTVGLSRCGRLRRYWISTGPDM